MPEAKKETKKHRAERAERLLLEKEAVESLPPVIKYEPEVVKDVRGAYGHIEGRLPPLWTAVLTVDSDAKLATIALKDGKGGVVKRLYRDDVVDEHGFYTSTDYARHVKWAWKRFLKTGR